MNFSLAREIYGQAWLVDSQSIQSLTALLSHFKQGGNLTPGEKNNDTYLYSIKNQVATTDNLYKARNDNSNDKLIAVTKVDGPITKNGGESSFGTIQMADRFRRFDKLSNIIGHIVLVDSGGGAASAIKYMRNVMLSTNKPVVGFGRDLVASAGYSIISAADYIIMNERDSFVGSIGTMAEFRGFKKVDEDKQTGERIVRVYADQSTEKNIEFEEAINNLNLQPVKENWLNPLNQDFINEVIAARPNVTEKQLKGALLMADQTVGTLIDSIGTFEDAVNKVIELSKNKTPKGAINNKNQKVMTKAEVKAEHPEVYNEIVAEGVKKESGRVNALLPFMEIDKEAVVKKLKDGTDADQVFMAEMTVKGISKKQLDAEKEESAPAVETAQELNDEQKEKAETDAFYKEVRQSVGLNVEG
jgi:protease-4